MRKQILVIAFLLAVGIDASAQEFTGSIYGRIVDPTNALMPGVSITVEGDAIQGQRTAESEANGSYRFLNLPPGEYRVTYQKSKFKTIVYEGATVEVNKTVTMNVTMQIAEIEETLVVTGGSPIVDVKNATVGTNFGEAMLRDIPNQRDLFALLAQTPGITMPRVDVGGNTAGTQSAYRAYGLSGQSITTVDGVNITAGSDGVGAYVDYGALAEAKISAAGNSADVAVAGAAVTTVIKSGSNTPHGEGYADIKPGSTKQYDGAEHFALYRDINGQLGGPFIKDRLWYFTSFRDQYNKFSTGMYDKPADQGGTDGQLFTTATTDYTLKLNYQLTRKSTLTFMTQLGRKHQPYRFGSGAGAYQYLVESTALQKSWSHIGKVDYMRVISNRATLDTSINVYGTHFPLDAHTDKTPIIDDVTFLRSGAYNTPSLSQDRRWHYNANLNLYADRHDMKIGYMFQWYAPRYTAYGAPGPDGTAGHFYIATSNGVPSAFWTDNGPVWHVNTLKNHALFFQDKFQVTSKTDAQLRHSLRSVPQLLSRAEVRPERQQAVRQRYRLRRRSVRRPDGHAGAPRRDVQHRGAASRAHLRPLRQFEDGPEGQLGQILDESGGVHCRARESDRPHHQEVRVGQQLPDGGSRGRRNADHAGVCRDASADPRRRATDAHDRQSEPEGLVHR